MRGFRSGLIDLLLPPTCAGCGGASEGALCPACRDQLPWIRTDACLGCQTQDPLPGETHCAACALRSSPLDACLAACWFEAAAADWIRDYKYAVAGGSLLGTDRARMRALAIELGRRAPAEPPDRVVPVPLHASRLKKAG